MIKAHETLAYDSFLKSRCEATAGEAMVTTQFKDVIMSFYESLRI